MSKQIISNQKITRTYKISSTSEQYSSNPKLEPTKIISKQNYIRNTLESSGGQNQQRSTDNQSICTCGKFRSDTHSTYNGTIQTKLQSEECNTGDEGKDISLCNCYKKNTNRASKISTGSYKSNNILIQDNNRCTCHEGQNMNMISKYNINKKIYKKECTCGKGDHEYEINTTTTNDVQLDTIETKDNEDKENIEELTKISKKEQEQSIIKKDKEIKVDIKQLEQLEQKKEEEISWNGDIFIQIMERLQYLAAKPPELTVQFPNDMMINRTVYNGPINILIPIPENYIQKQGFFEVLPEVKDQLEGTCPENVDLLNISNAYSIQIPTFNNLEIENTEMFIQSEPLGIHFKIENYAWDISANGRLWSGDIIPIRTNRLEIEDKTWNDLIQKETVEKLTIDISDIHNPFKIIELSDNEVITLKAKKKVLKVTQTQESSLKVGGDGFKPRVWDLVPTQANSMTIEVHKPLKIVSESMLMPPERKRRPNWNLVNTSSLESTVDYLVKEKIIEQQSLNPITLIEENTLKNKWQNKIREQLGIRLTYKKKDKRLKWTLSICSKVIDLFFEHSIDDVVINDDYNNVQGPQMRPIIVTVLKANEADDTSSISSYDVFQNLVIKKGTLNFELGKNRNIEINIKKNIQSEYEMDGKIKKFNGKLRMEENRQKNQNDKTVRNLVHQTKNLMGNMLGISRKEKKIEFVKEETGDNNYLKV